MLDGLAGIAEFALQTALPKGGERVLAEDAIIAAHSGTITIWAARHHDVRGSMMFLGLGNARKQACAVPYALAAAVAHPGRQVIAFVGDGGFSMLLGELATAVKYKLDIKIVGIRNNTLGQIKWEQMVFLGNPEFSCDLQPINFAAVAREFGIPGFTIEDPVGCGDTCARPRRRRGRSSSMPL